MGIRGGGIQSMDGCYVASVGKWVIVMELYYHCFGSFGWRKSLQDERAVRVSEVFCFSEQERGGGV